MRNLLVVLALLTSLVGCGTQRSPTETSRRVLIYGRGEDSKSLDPINAETGETVKVLLNIYDSLVAFHDETLDIVPALATHWETSDDHLTWTFHLREGVRFHDGTPLDAEAVIFSLQRLIQDNHPFVPDPARPFQPSYRVIREITAPDSMTVMIQLREPNAVFLNNLAMFPASIVSPTAVKKLGAGFATQPAGTGPFRLERWLRDQQLVLAANEDYWNGRPKTDRLVFVPISEGATRVQRLRRGEIHIADELPPAELDALATEPGLVVQEQTAMNVAYLTMQMEQPPFDDVRVRQAVALALDKAELVRVAYAGHAEPAVNMLPRNMWGHHDGLQDRPYDPQQARELLKSVAVDRGLALPLPVKLAVMSESRPYMEQPLQVAALVKDSLAVIGMDVTIDPRPVNTHFQLLMAGAYEMALAGWVTDNGDPDNFLYSLLDPDNISQSGNNFSRYHNAEVHQLLLAAQRELDRDKRAELYRQVQELAFADVPTVPLVSTQQRIAQAARVKDYKLHPATLIRLRHAYLADG